MNLKAGHTISQIRQVSNRIFERILSERKIDAFNGAQGRILYVLWQEEHISLREIADRTGLAATTLTSMIDRMEAAGLVRRLPDPDDRRKTLLALTEKAGELQPDYMAVSTQMNDIFYQGFSEEEIRLCESMLERIYGNLKRHDQISQNTKSSQSPKSVQNHTRERLRQNPDRRLMMNQNVRDYVTEKVNELLNAPSCCAEAKAAAQNWLDAVGTDREADASRGLITELEMDIMPVDGLIAFAESEVGAQVFGAEMAKNAAAHGRELKAAGAKYCDCPACAASEAILKKKDELL